MYCIWRVKKNDRFHHIQKRAQSKFNQISKFHRFIECRSHHWTQNSYRTPLFTLIWPEWKGRPVHVGGITEIKDPPSWTLICFSPQSCKSTFHRKTLKKCHWGFSGTRHHIKWISKMACHIWATGNSNCIYNIMQFSLQLMRFQNNKIWVHLLKKIKTKTVLIDFNNGTLQAA